MLRIATTRGDRLFITLLGAAFIHLAWLGARRPRPVVGLGLSLVYAAGGVSLGLSERLEVLPVGMSRPVQTSSKSTRTTGGTTCD